MKVYVMEAEHQTVPGRRMSVHATAEGAAAAAVECVLIMWNDTDAQICFDAKKPIPFPTVDNWAEVIERLQEIHGAQYMYAEVSHQEVRS